MNKKGGISDVDNFIQLLLGLALLVMLAMAAVSTVAPTKSETQNVRKLWLNTRYWDYDSKQYMIWLEGVTENGSKFSFDLKKVEMKKAADTPLAKVRVWKKSFSSDELFVCPDKLAIYLNGQQLKNFEQIKLRAEDRVRTNNNSAFGTAPGYKVVTNFLKQRIFESKNIEVPLE